MPKQRVVARNMSFHPSDLKAIESVSQQMGLDNFSAATRFIIREWQRLKERYEPSAQNAAESGTLESAQ